MKTILLFIGLALNFIVNAQWTYQTVNDGFDEPYKIAYTKENNNAILKLENVEGKIYFYLQGGYHCEDYPTVDLVFMINNVPQRYTLDAFTSKDKSTVFLCSDLYNNTIYSAFKECSTVKIRINESTCTSDIYIFNMSNSTSAFNFMK
jgi:hypothetical protein